MTVVTDLVTSHAAWQLGRADRMAVPSAAVRRRCHPLGVSERRFLAVLTGGSEGSGGMARRVAAILGSSDDIDVVAYQAGLVRPGWS